MTILDDIRNAPQGDDVLRALTWFLHPSMQTLSGADFLALTPETMLEMGLDEETQTTITVMQNQEWWDQVRNQQEREVKTRQMEMANWFIQEIGTNPRGWSVEQIIQMVNSSGDDQFLDDIRGLIQEYQIDGAAMADATVESLVAMGWPQFKAKMTLKMFRSACAV